MRQAVWNAIGPCSRMFAAQSVNSLPPRAVKVRRTSYMTPILGQNYRDEERNR